MSIRSLHRTEPPLHPFIIQARQLAREAGSSDNGLINWAVRLQEDAMKFGNGKRS